jgi:hypothetical protein
MLQEGDTPSYFKLRVSFLSSSKQNLNFVRILLVLMSSWELCLADLFLIVSSSFTA